MRVAIGILFIIGCVCASVRFDNFKVYRVIPSNESQMEALRNMEEMNMGFSFWMGPSHMGRPVDIMVPPHLKYDFEDFIVLQNLKYEVYIDNVQEKIDNEKAVVKPRAFGWTDYHRLDDIYAWMDELAEKYDSVEVIVGGESYEGRHIKGVKVSFSPNNANNAVFLEGGIHAREWIAPAVVTYQLNEILTSTDEAVREMAERYDWYIFPVVNPDGYEYTHTRDRLWRKTRVPYGLCHGADPNRNWAYQWMSGGASSNPCSETYAGPNAFSEPSMASLSSYITSISDKIVAYIGYHSYSQLLLFPYGHTAEHLDNHDELQAVGDKAAASLASRYGTRYQVGNIVETIYVASGGSMDWVKGNYGTRITYTYELRDTGANGFLLPANQIIPCGEETLDSLVTIMDEFNKM